MGRWGLDGMRSFEQPGVARKEASRLENSSRETTLEDPPVAEQQLQI